MRIWIMWMPAIIRFDEINIKKLMTIRIINTKTDHVIQQYQGSTKTTNGGIKKDVNIRHSKVEAPFGRLQSI